MKLLFRESALFLLEVPSECACLDIKIVERAGEGRETVIIIDDKSYILKKRESSNTHLLVTPGHAHSVFSEISSLLETRPREPKHASVSAHVSAVSFLEVKQFAEKRRSSAGGVSGLKIAQSRKSAILERYPLSEAEFSKCVRDLRLLNVGHNGDSLYFKLERSLFMETLLLAQSVFLSCVDLAQFDALFLEVFPEPLLDFVKTHYFAEPGQKAFDAAKINEDLTISALMEDLEDKGNWERFTLRLGKMGIAPATRKEIEEIVRRCTFSTETSQLLEYLNATDNPGHG